MKRRVALMLMIVMLMFGSAIAILEQLKNATGIDIEKLARGTTPTSAPTSPRSWGDEQPHALRIETPRLGECGSQADYPPL